MGITLTGNSVWKQYNSSPGSTNCTKKYKRVQQTMSRPDGLSLRELKECATQGCWVGFLAHLQPEPDYHPCSTEHIMSFSCPQEKAAKHPPWLQTSNFDFTCHEVTGKTWKHLCSIIEPSLDPQLFAHQPHIGVEDGIIIMLNRSSAQLNEAGSNVSVNFDSSCAFNK